MTTADIIRRVYEDAAHVLDMIEHSHEEHGRIDSARQSAREAKAIRARMESVLANPALIGVTEWMPFNTAPRDGTDFLAYGGGLESVDICSYNARVGCWNCGSTTLDDTDTEPEGYNRPTHWMPKPPAPLPGGSDE